MVLGPKTSGSTKRSLSELAFFSAIIAGWLYRSSVCISCPNRSHKDRCVRFFALPGHMTFSLRQVHRGLVAKPRKYRVQAITLGIIQWSIWLRRRHIFSLTRCSASFAA
jgi:hypothetical protein